MGMRLIISLLSPLLIGFAGSFFTSSAIDNWYSNLVKPPFTPPNWLFAPVWTVLYILIGINLYSLWTKRREGLITKDKIVLYLLQLVLNGVWSPVFFGLQAPLTALIIIIPLWLILLTLFIKLLPRHKINAWLILPYLLWVTVATYLNLGIVFLNPSVHLLGKFLI